ncbi:MAG: class I SAM-dependent methyltransferase, partial [Thermoplasmata archaeon]
MDGIGAVGLGVQWPRHLPAEFEQLDMAGRHFRFSVRVPMFKSAHNHLSEKLIEEERRLRPVGMETEDLPKGLASSNAGKIAKRLGSVSGGRVLDVATARGGFIDTLMKTLKNYDSFVGIDYCASAISKKEMESAKKRFEGKAVRFFEMNAENMKFEDRSFDTVCMSHSLHHLGEIDRVLAEMKRVLKIGGNFILQEVYCDGDQTEAQKADELEHEWEARIDSLLGITHNKTFTKQRIMNIVNSLELRELEVFDSTHPIDCLFCNRKHECEDPKNL